MNKDAKPVTKWGDQDKALLNAVQGIRRVVESLQLTSTSTNYIRDTSARTYPNVISKYNSSESVSERI